MWIRLGEKFGKKEKLIDNSSNLNEILIIT